MMARRFQTEPCFVCPNTRWMQKFTLMYYDQYYLDVWDAGNRSRCCTVAKAKPPKLVLLRISTWSKLTPRLSYKKESETLGGRLDGQMMGTAPIMGYFI